MDIIEKQLPEQPLHSVFDAQYIEQEIQYFRKLCKQMIAKFAGKELAEDVYLIDHPKYLSSISASDDEYSPYSKADLQRLRSKPYVFAISAIIHGDEVAGICSLNLFLESLLTEKVNFYAPILVMLGNVQAARKGVRKVDEDLNRAFARDYANNHESLRAKALKPILQNVAFYFDLHQTIGPSPQGFFIFAYHPYRFHFARSILPRTDVVTYWDGRYTAEGMCADHFVNIHGGVAITLELGPKGFYPWSISIGYQGLIAAYHYAMRVYYGQSYISSQRQGLAQYSTRGNIFTWSEVIPYPQTGTVEPTRGTINFQKVNQGFQLAQWNGNPIYTSTSGRLLFPTYIRAQDGDQSLRPCELARILKSITEDDLPSKP